MFHQFLRSRCSPLSNRHQLDSVLSNQAAAQAERLNWIRRVGNGMSNGRGNFVTLTRTGEEQSADRAQSRGAGRCAITSGDDTRALDLAKTLATESDFLRHTNAKRLKSGDQSVDLVK